MIKRYIILILTLLVTLSVISLNKKTIAPYCESLDNFLDSSFKHIHYNLKTTESVHRKNFPEKYKIKNVPIIKGMSTTRGTSFLMVLQFYNKKVTYEDLMEIQNSKKFNGKCKYTLRWLSVHLIAGKHGLRIKTLANLQRKIIENQEYFLKKYNEEIFPLVKENISKKTPILVTFPSRIFYNKIKYTKDSTPITGSHTCVITGYDDIKKQITINNPTGIEQKISYDLFRREFRKLQTIIPINSH